MDIEKIIEDLDLFDVRVDDDGDFLEELKKLCQDPSYEDFSDDFLAFANPQKIRVLDYNSLADYQRWKTTQKDKKQESARRQQKFSSRIGKKDAVRSSAAQLLSVYGATSQQEEDYLTTQGATSPGTIDIDETTQYNENQNFFREPRTSVITSTKFTFNFTVKSVFPPNLDPEKENLDSLVPTNEKLSLRNALPPHMQLNDKYAYMYQKPWEVAESIIYRAEDLAETIREQQGFTDLYFPVGRPNPSDSWVFGQIYNEESSGKLNTNSPMLQGFPSSLNEQQEDELNQDQPLNAYTQLDLRQIDKVSLFPGLICALRGSDPSGKNFIATEMVSGLIPSSAKEMGELMPVGGDSIDIVVASGPYLFSQEPYYEPFYSLLVLAQIVNQQPQPNLVMLMGPFFDPHLKLFTDVRQAEKFSDVFEKIVAHISDLVKETNIQVVLIPCPGKDLANVPIYPCPPFSLKKISTPRNIHFFSEPCVLNFAGITIGASSTDILKHLSMEEVFRDRSGAKSDRIGRLIEHLLAQQSFYPLYPPNEKVNVEIKLLGAHAAIPFKPHLMLLASDLTHFMKNVSGVFCLNPGRLTRGGQNLGTYGRISIKTQNFGATPLEEKIVGKIIKIDKK